MNRIPNANTKEGARVSEAASKNRIPKRILIMVTKGNHFFVRKMCSIFLRFAGDIKTMNDTYSKNDKPNN